MYLKVIILLSLTSACFPAKKEKFPRAGNIPDPNDYVDDIVHHIKEHILKKKLDPYTAIDNTILTTHVTGSLVGLGTMIREGDAAVVYKPNDIQSIQSKLRVHLLKGQLKWSTSVLIYATITGTAGVSIQNVGLQINLDMNIEKGHFVVSEFEIIEVGNVNVELDVAPIFDFIVTSVSNLIASLTKNVVFRLIDGPVKLALQKIIDEHALEVSKSVK